MMKTPKLKGAHGGFRPGSGRHPNPDRAEWGRVTCKLKHATIAELRESAQSFNFGDYLQWHLEKYPPLEHEVYQKLLRRQPIFEQVGKRRVQVLYSGPVRKRRRNVSAQVPRPSEGVRARLAAKIASRKTRMVKRAQPAEQAA